MRKTKILQSRRSQSRKGNPRYWVLGTPKYSLGQVLKAKRLLRQVSADAGQIKTDFYVFKD